MDMWTAADWSDKSEFNHRFVCDRRDKWIELIAR